MIRLFVYLVIILALGFGFSWVADHPGVVTLNWQGKDIQTSLMVALVALVALIATIVFVWGVFKGVIGLPTMVSKFFTNRRRDRGYKALSTGLIAASTGDKALARRLMKESGKLLTNEPLVDLLDAQTSLMEGNRQAARDKFHAMLENEDTKLLGLRGLYLEAEREGAREASRQYAEEASQMAPSLAWAGNAKLRNLSIDANWQGALNTLESNRSAGLIDKDAAKRQRAVLLTARAMAEEPANPDLAAKLASEANRLAPGLVPAAIIGASAYVRVGKLRKASKLIEAVWEISPHPELADAYIHMRIGDSASDRLKRAQALAKFSSSHPQSKIAIAEAAIEAKDWQCARDAMKNVLTNNLSERACLIMAVLEEGEHGEAGRMRDWLARAVRAPRDAMWTADGYTSKTWLPVSPMTGEIDVFEWKVPVEQLQASNESIDLGDLAEPLKPLPVVEIKNNQADGSDVDATSNVPKNNEEKTVTEDNQIKAEVEVNEPVVTNGDTTTIDQDVEPSKTIFPLPRRPDDPGIDDGSGKKQSKA